MDAVVTIGTDGRITAANPVALERWGDIVGRRPEEVAWRPPAPHDLSIREVEALDHAARGLTNRAIAEAMHVSPHTVKNQLDRAIRKLGAHSKLEAVTAAVREGIISLGVLLTVVEAIPLTT